MESLLSPLWTVYLDVGSTQSLRHCSPSQPPVIAGTTVATVLNEVAEIVNSAVDTACPGRMGGRMNREHELSFR